MAKPARQSPILGAVSTMIGEASDTLVTSGGRFRHSFEVDMAAITPDPLQARRHFDPQDIRGLAVTMGEQGQLQPILLRRDVAGRNRWVIVAGERRWRAAQALGWKQILAIEHVGDPEVTALIENLQRVDLSPVEEARGLQRLINDKGWNQDRAAASLGKSKADVSAILGILTLPSPLLDAVLTSELSLSKHVLVELARVEAGPLRDSLVALAQEGKLTVRGIRNARMESERGRHEFRSGAAAKEVSVEALPASKVRVRALDKLATELRAVRTEERSVKPAERAALRALRKAIDELLDQAG